MIVYVGKTKDPHERFTYYQRPSACHNQQLAAWLRGKGDKAGVIVLAHEPADLNAAERHWISALRPSLFNLVHGGDQAWRNHKRQPWMARTGIHCPSALMIRQLASFGKHFKEAIADIRERRARMSVEERVMFELNICAELWDRFRGPLQNWWVETTERIDPILMTVVRRDYPHLLSI